MRELGLVVIEYGQAFGGKGVQDGVDVRPGRTRQPGVQVFPGDRAAGQPSIAAGHGHAAQNFPGQRLLPGRQGFVDPVGAGLHGVADPPGLSVAVAGQPGPLALLPGQRHRLGQQRQHAGGTVRARGPQIPQDGVGQRGIDSQPGRLRRPGYRHPELGFGHRPDHELPVLQRARQLGNGGTPVPEIPAYRDHHQRGRFQPRSDRVRGGRAQRRDECLPGSPPVEVRVQREDLLELVHDEH